VTAYRGLPVLVLGAAGFIGRWVARALTDAGAELTLAVRAGEDGDAVFRAWGARGRVSTVDLADASTVAALVARARPAAVFNLAGYGVRPTERDADLAQRLNADLPALLARAAADAAAPGWRGQRVIHVGSALEYGTATGDLSEGTVPLPTTLYGRTKLEGTRRLAVESAALGVRAVTARLFTVYGAGEHEGRLLPTLIAAARTTGPIPLTAGTQQRDFTSVEDVADGLLRLGALEAGALGAVNLATGRLTTVRAFVETAARVLGIAPGRLRFGELPTRPEEMAHDPVSLAKLRDLLGWAPATAIADGVARAAAFTPAS
jgi:nucleoside-diphosphate-sugar epimerase